MSGFQSLDLRLFEHLNGVPHPEWLNAFFWAVTSLGLGWVQAGGVVAISLIWWRGRGRFFASEAARRLLWPGLWSFALSGLLSQALKRLIERPRPPDLGAKALDEYLHAYSFPSGHATTSFALAVVAISITHGTRRAWIGWLAVVLALMIGYSRVYRGVHYPSDVLGGALLGALVSLGVLWFFRRRYQASGNSE